MNQGGTYGDHITLQAASNLFNVQIILHSSLGEEATVNVSPVTGAAVATFHLGHFAEGNGEHYVCLVAEEHINVNNNANIAEEQEREERRWEQGEQRRLDEQTQDELGREERREAQNDKEEPE